MLSKHKTETSPVAKAMGGGIKVAAAALGGESAVHAVSVMGRLLKIFGIGRVKVQEQSAPETAHQRGAKIDDLRD